MLSPNQWPIRISTYFRRSSSRDSVKALFQKQNVKIVFSLSIGHAHALYHVFDFIFLRSNRELGIVLRAGTHTIANGSAAQGVAFSGVSMRLVADPMGAPAVVAGLGGWVLSVFGQNEIYVIFRTIATMIQSYLEQTKLIQGRVSA